MRCVNTFSVIQSNLKKIAPSDVDISIRFENRYQFQRPAFVFALVQGWKLSLIVQEVIVGLLFPKKKFKYSVE